MPVGARAIALRTFAVIFILGLVTLVVLLAMQVAGQHILWKPDGSASASSTTNSSFAKLNPSMAAAASATGNPLPVSVTGMWSAQMQIGNQPPTMLGTFSFRGGRAVPTIPFEGVAATMFNVRLRRVQTQTVADVQIHGGRLVTMQVSPAAGNQVKLTNGSVTIQMGPLSGSAVPWDVATANTFAAAFDSRVQLRPIASDTSYNFSISGSTKGSAKVSTKGSMRFTKDFYSFATSPNDPSLPSYAVDFKPSYQNGSGFVRASILLIGGQLHQTLTLKSVTGNTFLFQSVQNAPLPGIKRRWPLATTLKLTRPL